MHSVRSVPVEVNMSWFSTSSSALKRKRLAVFNVYILYMSDEEQKKKTFSTTTTITTATKNVNYIAQKTSARPGGNA